MIHLDERARAQSRKSFHDASARAAYASHFRPIAIQAVAAGTRWSADALRKQSEGRKGELPGVLRHGFDD